MTRGGRAAFLDLDHTLIDVDSGMRFAHHIVESQRSRIKASAGVERARLRRRHRLRLLEVYAKGFVFLPLYRARVMRRSRLVRESYAFFRGEQVEAVRASLHSFFDDELSGRVYPGVQVLLDWHRARGDVSVIVTSAPQSVARLFADLLGIDHAVGVRLEHRDGVLTGRVAKGPLWGGDKKEVVQGLCREHGWDPSSSFAYSDHVSDAAFLESVGRPVAVHPNPRLAREAARRGWPVLDLRDPEAVRGVLQRWEG